MRKRKKYSNETTQDKILDVCFYVIVTVVVILCIYPVYFVLIASFSSATAVNSGRFLLYPQEFHLTGYKFVLENKDILVGYYNTIIYTVLGTFLGLAFCIPAGYALSRKELPARRIIIKLMVFTMYFSGGLIPTYLVVKSLNLIDSRWSVILLGCVSVYNIILIRRFCESNISDEILEAARIDGSGNIRFFFQFVIPLSKAIIAVIALYLAVSYWNSYYNALIYITDGSKKPLQIVLRELLMTANNASDIQDGELSGDYLKMVQVVKYAVIVVATAPIVCVYPFLQKYFVQGVMIGSVKG